jgi:CRP/FNR family transcriptional regulator, cyclic AMP receptor protein
MIAARVPGRGSGIAMTIVAPLVRSSLLDALGPVEREAVIAHLRPRQYKRGQAVFNDGDHGDCLYLVQSGRLDVKVTTPRGHTITLRIVHPGEFIGELALVHPDQARTGRACALEPTEALALYRHDFEAVRRCHPGVDRFLVAALAERVIRTCELAVELLLPPELRVWRRLEALAVAYGDEPIRMSQDDLAHAAGTVRQTVNRVLRHGVRDRVLAVERGAIHVLDLDAVERLASH